MEFSKSIGIKLKTMRLDQGMTLKDVSEKVDLSQGFLSQVESGRATLGIQSLYKLAELYSIPPSTLLELPGEQRTGVVRSYDRHNLAISSEFIQYSLFDNFEPNTFNVYMYEILPNTHNSKEDALIFNHSAMEFQFILEGSLTVLVQNEEHVLNPNDGIKIMPHIDHGWYNHTNKICKCLVILQETIKK